MKRELINEYVSEMVDKDYVTEAEKSTFKLPGPDAMQMGRTAGAKGQKTLEQEEAAGTITPDDQKRLDAMRSKKQPIQATKPTDMTTPDTISAEVPEDEAGPTAETPVATKDEPATPEEESEEDMAKKGLIPASMAVANDTAKEYLTKENLEAYKNSMDPTIDKGQAVVNSAYLNAAKKWETDEGMKTTGFKRPTRVDSFDYDSKRDAISDSVATESVEKGQKLVEADEKAATEHIRLLQKECMWFTGDFYSAKGPEFHNDGGWPAYMFRNELEGGKVRYIFIWFENNERHRLDGPSIYGCDASNSNPISFYCIKGNSGILKPEEFLGEYVKQYNQGNIKKQDSLLMGQIESDTYKLPMQKFNLFKHVVDSIPYLNDLQDPVSGK